VFQKKGQWFVNYQGGPIPFFSGMRLAWLIDGNGSALKTPQTDSLILLTHHG
jgi:hypothetical protein